jgi:glycine hydroxymethyltransferase
VSEARTFPLTSVPWASKRVQARVAELSSQVPVGDPDAIAELLQDSALLAEHSFACSANLYAGANVVSERSKSVTLAGIGSRPTLGWPGEKFPTGVEVLDIIEVAATETIRAATGAAFADVRPPSATLANLAVLTALAQPGDTIAALPERAGGHISHRSGAPAVRGLHVATLPYDYDTLDVDTGVLPSFLAEVAPKLVILGGSLMLRPHDIATTAATAHKQGIPVLYDGSHVAGLIASGLFQQPLQEGADILTFSTYKSFGGPAGGVICTNDASLAELLSAAVHPVLTANYDIGRLAPLAVAASELIADGKGYASQAIDNARQFGKYLAREGLCVIGENFGYTESHQLAVDVREFGGGVVASDLLARARIFMSPSPLPSRTPERTENGLRLGTQEVTRRGLRPIHLERLARIIAAVLRADLAAVNAADQVAVLVAECGAI